MASHRSIETGTAATTTSHGPTLALPARDAAYPAGGSLLKRAALYARISTEKQEREETVASQVDLLYKTAEAQGYDIPPDSVFLDEGVSGTRLDRPALDRLRDLAAEGAFEVILVTAPDRLARRYAYQVVLVEEFTRCGCEVIFVQHSLGTSPEEQMLLQMQGVFAEYERALIQERTRRGRLFAARQGRVNWGNPPYGYAYVRKTPTTPQHLLINEVEAEIVRQMYRWCVEEQLSSYAIQRRLTTQGLPPRKATRGWAQSSVIEILRDSIYKGDAYYNRTQQSDTQRPYKHHGFKDRRPGNGQGRTRRPPHEWIPVRVPALIDPELWERAQAQLARNRERARRHNTQHRYLLRSLLVCGRCGQRMTGTWNQYGGRYICAARYPRHAPGACTGRSLSATRIEPWVWDHVKRLLSDPAVLRMQYEQGRGDPAIDVRAEQERGRLERKLAALDREVTRLNTSWYRVFPSRTGIYEWVRVDAAPNSGQGFALAAGSHIIQVGHGEIGARLDALYVTDTRDPPPTGPCALPSGGYEGFGRNTTGGSGQTLYRVTNLNNDGPGSLREAVSRSNRCVVFDVGGTMNLSSRISVGGDNITVDGFTAPAPGITLHGGVSIAGKANIVARGIRVREATDNSDDDGFQIFNSRNVVLDHCSATNWADGAIDITQDSHDVTVQWCIFGPGDPARNHNLLNLIAYNAYRITEHHNLFYRGAGRSPFARWTDNCPGSTPPDVVLDFRSNLIWRFGQSASQLWDGWGNVVNNYYYGVDDGTDDLDAIEVRGGCGGRWHTSGNYSRNGHNLNNNGNWAPAHSVPPVTTEGAQTAAPRILNNAGARGPHFGLDAIDQSYINSILSEGL